MNPNVLADLAAKLLDQHQWCVYYHSTICDWFCIADTVIKDVSFEEALACVKQQPLKSYSRVEREDQDEFNQIVDSHSFAVSDPQNTPLLAGPFICFGKPDNISGECDPYYITPAINYSKQDILALLDK